MSKAVLAVDYCIRNSERLGIRTVSEDGGYQFIHAQNLALRSDCNLSYIWVYLYDKNDKSFHFLCDDAELKIFILTPWWYKTYKDIISSLTKIYELEIKRKKLLNKITQESLAMKLKD